MRNPRGRRLKMGRGSRSLMASLLFVVLLLTVLLLSGSIVSIAWVAGSFILSWIASTTAFLFRMLTLDGRRAATVLGTITLGFGGWVPALLLLFFFISSSILGRVLTPGTARNDSLDERRDGHQVWANGIWVAFLCLGYDLTDDPIIAFLITSALAVVTADTWASLVGRAVSGRTWHLLNFRRVEPGEEGGVSVAGTMAATVAALLFGLAAVAWIPLSAAPLFWSVFGGGITGCMIDSLLGQWHASSLVRRSPTGDSLTSDITVNDWINASSTVLGIGVSCVIWFGGAG